jgi:hypothetical protein
MIKALADYEELIHDPELYDYDNIDEMLVISYLDHVFTHTRRGEWKDFIRHVYSELNNEKFQELPDNFKKWYVPFLKKGGIIKLQRHIDYKYEDIEDDRREKKGNGIRNFFYRLFPSLAPIPQPYKKIEEVTNTVILNRGHFRDFTVYEFIVNLLFKKYHCKCPRCGQPYIQEENMFKSADWRETLLTGYCGNCWNEATRPVNIEDNMPSSLLSKDIDDKLAIAYLESENKNNDSLESMIEAYYTMFKEFEGFRELIFELITEWYTSFRKTFRFKKLLEDESVWATIIDMADYEDPRKVAYNIAFYPRIAYNGDTAFERLIKNLYKEYKANKRI